MTVNVIICIKYGYVLLGSFQCNWIQWVSIAYGYIYIYGYINLIIVI